MDERRRNYRVSHALPVTLAAGSQRLRGFATDLSPGGIRVETKTTFAAGTRVHGRVVLPGGDELEFDADIRWARRSGAAEGGAPRAMGLEFRGPPEERYYTFLRRAWDQSAAPVNSPLGPRADAFAARALAQESPAAAGEGRTRAPSKTPATRSRTPQGERKSSPVRTVVPGLRAFSAMVVGSAEWDQLAGTNETYLGAAVAALLIERAAAQAVQPSLAKGMRTLARETDVSVNSDGPIARGATIVASAVLSSIADDKGALTFDGVVLEGGRTLAVGRHICATTRA